VTFNGLNGTTSGGTFTFYGYVIANYFTCYGTSYFYDVSNYINATTNNLNINSGTGGGQGSINLSISYNTQVSINNTGVTFKGLNGTTSGGTFTFYGTVTATSFNATSDYRIKANIAPINTINMTIDNLIPYSYTNLHLNKFDVGFIAHEVQQQYPFMVTGEKDAIDNDGNPVYQSINYQPIITLLVAEVKELKKQIAKQQEQINQLIAHFSTTA
jgi:hypothetical protein